jgi:hemoglobin-like flavoprotein
MNPHQIALVRRTWKQVEPIAEQAAATFYVRLFELDPELRPLFTGDMAAQGRKLMTMIGMVVHTLDDLSLVIPAIRASGARHRAYGVQPGHYDTVGAALLWTLKRWLADEFTQEVESAWAAAYTLLANVMKDAADEAA